MPIEFTSTIGDVLISNGVQVLGHAIKHTTEAGTEKLRKLIQNKTNIDLFNKDIVENGLDDDQLDLLKEMEQNYLEDIERIKNTHSAKPKSPCDKPSIENTEKIQESITISNKGGWLGKNFIYIFASFWSIVAASYIFLITFFIIPPDNVRFADTILGFILGTVISGIIQFYFGSSFKATTYASSTKTIEK